MKDILKKILDNFGISVSRSRVKKRYRSLYAEYKSYTMTPEAIYYENLLLTEEHAKKVEGDVVECGVWRGGMIAGVARIMGSNSRYFLFDSFEGLPDAKPHDGSRALEWQKNKDSEFYFDNCRAEVEYSIEAMKSTGCSYTIVKGWFEETIPSFSDTNKIALLRLDGDWYDSILISLKYLYPKVVNRGIVIIDDYFAWDGCSKAVHDYLVSIKSNAKIRSTNAGVTYIVKTDSNE